MKHLVRIKGEFIDVNDISSIVPHYDTETARRTHCTVTMNDGRSFDLDPKTAYSIELKARRSQR